MASQTDTQLAAALQHLSTHPDSSFRAVAKLYDVDRTTLSRHARDGRNRQEGQSDKQLLSPKQEEMLIRWLLQLEEDGHARTPATIREIAGQISQQSGGPSKVGKHWLSRFYTRHPEIHPKKGVLLASERANNANSKDLSLWFKHFERIPKQHKIDPANIWNMDETGLQLGCCKNHTVVGSSSSKSVTKKGPQNRVWVSIAETISMIGTIIRCLVIFKAKEVQNDWFCHDEVPDWCYTANNSAWMNNELAVKWLKALFLPETAPIASNTHRILLLDGFKSHATEEFMVICLQNNVHIIYLPAHCSHVLQPLDLAPFSQLKRSYRQQIEELSFLEDAAPVKKIRFVRYYNEARKEAFTPQYIKTGWRAAGLYPWNPQKILRSSRVTQTPATPKKRPRSPTESTFNTPRNKKQLREIELAIAEMTPGTRTHRFALRKITKGFEQIHFEQALTAKQLMAQQLQSKEKEASSVKQKPIPDPNTTFLQLPDILEAQKAAVEAAEEEARQEAVRAANRAARAKKWDENAEKRAAEAARKAANEAQQLSIAQMSFVFDVDE